MDINQLLRSLGLQQAYQAYQQNIGEPFAAAVGGAGRGYLGFDKPEYGGLLGEEAYRMGQAMGNMPGLGAPAGAFKVGMQAAAKAPGLLADAVQMMKANPEAGLLAITGYHGSPHRFTKFDASKIGTGEGAQAYGHGLYFAESPNVAKEYRATLAGNDIIFSNDAAKQQATKLMPFGFEDPISVIKNAFGLSTNADDAIKFLRTSYKKDPDLNAHANHLANLLESGAVRSEKGGALYTVDIPDEMIGRMINYDKPLSKQSKEIQSKLKNVVDSEIGSGTWANWIKSNPDFRNLTNDLFENKTEAEISEILRKSGIPGIRYLDEGSRGVGKGTSNFVVFPGEEEAVRVLNVE